MRISRTPRMKHYTSTQVPHSFVPSPGLQRTSHEGWDKSGPCLPDTSPWSEPLFLASRSLEVSTQSRWLIRNGWPTLLLQLFFSQRSVFSAVFISSARRCVAAVAASSRSFVVRSSAASKRVDALVDVSRNVFPMTMMKNSSTWESRGVPKSRLP